MWIDSHCHLNHRNIREKGSIAELVSRAHENKVDGMLTICCRINEELDELKSISSEHTNVWHSIGTHPHDAGLEEEQNIKTETIQKYIMSNNNCIGIGESGLDYYYDNSPHDDQKASFIKHVHVAKETNVPLIIHTREAEDDTIQILRNEGACDGKTKVLMHCFSSNETLAKQSIDEGFYLSFSGMITFKKNDELRQIAKQVPLNRVLVETDAPYLAPMPHRGKINEPAFVSHTGAYMADLFNLTEEEFAQQTTNNFFKLFNKATLK